MRLTIAYTNIKKRNLVLINNVTYQRETLSERPIRQPLSRFQWSPNLDRKLRKIHIYADHVRFDYISILHCG